MNFMILWSFWITFQIFLKQTESHPILLLEQELGLNDADLLEDIYIAKNVSNRGLVDVLENFRLWQLERRKMMPSSTTKPTPEPMGLEVFLPRIPEIKIDDKTLGNLMKGFEQAAQDILKSFGGPPSTKPPKMTNVTTETPPNDLFCFLC